MAARLRVVTAVLLGVAALAVLGLGVYLLVVRDAAASEAEMRSWGPLHRALFVLAHVQHGAVVAGMAIAAGLVGVGLGYLVLRSAARWPLALIPVAAVGLIAVVHWSKGDIEASEPAGYRSRSTYVQAARALSTVSTVYLVVLALVAAAAWWLGRPRSVPAPVPAPPAA